MAIALTTAGNDRVEFGDISAISGLTNFTVAITFKLNAAPNNRRICGQWGGAAGSFLIQAVDTDEIGLVVNESGAGTFYGPKTTATNLSSGSTYRVVFQVSGLGGTQGQGIWVNGSAASTTPWFNNTNAGLINASSAVFVGYEAASAAACEDADYSEFAIWGSKLPDADCIAYGNGFSPDLLSRTGRILYAPFIRGTNDKWGGATGTLTGGSVAVHPRVIYPRRKQVVVASAAAPSTTVARLVNKGLVGSGLVGRGRLVG